MKRVDSCTWESPRVTPPDIHVFGHLFNAWPEFYHILYGVVKDMDLRLVSSVDPF